MTFTAAGARRALGACLGRSKTSRLFPFLLVLLVASWVPLNLVSFVPVLSAAGAPILNLHLDEGSGTTAGDASGSGNNGVLQNGPTWTTGMSAGALNFDGVNDTVY